MYRLTVQYETPTDPAAFDAEYFGKHVGLVAAIPGLKAMTFSKPTVVGPGTAPYLVAELDYEDEAAFLATRDTPEQAAAAAHADTLPAGRVMFVGELREN